MVAQIVTLAETKTFLNITTTAFDVQVGTFIDAASEMIVRRIGPVAGSPTYDEWYSGGAAQILLRHSPVQSVTSVTESFGPIAYTLTPQVLDAGAIGAYGYSLDVPAGLLTRRVSGIAAPFASGVQNVHVVYVAGYATPPADLVLACKLLLQHMWVTQRGGSKRPGQGGDDEWTPDQLRAFPPRVEQIMANHYVPGIA
jgi:hypothetical protein